jgi:electron transport complex protein RnfG
MSEGQPLLQVAPPRVWHMYRSLVGVGLLCGLLIVTVFELTRPVIDRNKAEALQRAIFRVLPTARSSAAFRLGDDGRFEILAARPGEGPAVYAGYDEQGQLVGLAVEAEGMGYQDVIGLLYGYSVADAAVAGIQVLESRETPGLGDKIETDEAFLRNFERLDVSLTEDGSAVAHPIEFVKPGQKQHPWQVDGITGATISSAAVAEILARSTSFWIPRVRRNLHDFRAAE